MERCGRQLSATNEISLRLVEHRERISSRAHVRRQKQGDRMSYGYVRVSTADTSGPEQPSVAQERASPLFARYPPRTVAFRSWSRPMRPAQPDFLQSRYAAPQLSRSSRLGVRRYS